MNGDLKYEIVKDRSGLTPGRLFPLPGLAQQIVQNEPASANSQLTALITGDRATANDPSQLAKYSICTSTPKCSLTDRMYCFAQALQLVRAAVLHESNFVRESVHVEDIEPFSGKPLSEILHHHQTSHYAGAQRRVGGFDSNSRRSALWTILRRCPMHPQGLPSFSQPSAVVSLSRNQSSTQSALVQP